MDAQAGQHFSCSRETKSGHLQTINHYKWAIIGPPAKRHLNGVSLACRWCPNIECRLGSCDFSGIRTCIARKPYIFCDFSGVRTPLPPLDPHMFSCCIFYFFSVNSKMYWQNLKVLTVSTVFGNSPTPALTSGRAFATRYWQLSAEFV